MICFLLVKFCTAEPNNIESRNFPEDYESCKNEGGQLFGPGNTICNAKLNVGFIFEHPPNVPGHWDAMGTEKIVIGMSKVEIIEIGVQTVTVSMHLKVSWREWRLFFNTQFPGAQAMIYLNEEHQQQIWSPQIVIGTNMVSQNKQGQKFGVGDGTDSFYSYYLMTTVKCEMDYQTFPFDHHVCNLMVSGKNPKINFHTPS